MAKCEHVKSLENYHDIDKELFPSIIAFSNQSTFKSKELFTCATVLYFPKLIRTIKENQEVRINNEELQENINKLEQLQITDKKEKSSHKIISCKRENN
jgi:regulator of replication initiation timing